MALLHVVLSRPEIVWQSEVPASMVSVIRHIEESYAGPLYVHELARIGGMSETAFRRKFEACRGVSPSQFVAQVRVREAAHLLASTELEMSRIAELSGFPNAAYMSRVFRHITGESPARFRRISRNALLSSRSGRSD